jgi:hypothetical protein
MIWTRLCSVVSPKMYKMNDDLICDSRHDMKYIGIATCGRMLLVIKEADPKLANEPKQIKHQVRPTVIYHPPQSFTASVYTPYFSAVFSSSNASNFFLIMSMVVLISMTALLQVHNLNLLPSH